MKVLHHPNIVRYYETYETKDNKYIVADLVSGGDLLTYILEVAFIDEYEASFIFKQLVETVLYLHNSGIIHRDLKPDNILLERDEKTKKIVKAKLIDFGFAAVISHIDKNSDACGTLNYVAPEVILGTVDNEKSDNFSLGVILYLMYDSFMQVTRHSSFPGSRS